VSQQTTLGRPAVHAAPTATRHRLALAILVTCQLMLILDATVMNVALPRIQSALHFSPTSLSWVITAYTLTYGGLLLLGGRAGDILGRRRMFIGGVAVFTVASLLGGLAPTAGWLVATRVLQGVGAAAAGPSTIALISTTFTEPRERLRALSLLSAVASAGFAIGLIVGGLLTQIGSWRWVLFINVPFGTAAVLLAPGRVREPERHPARLDLPGAVLATGALATIVYALTRAAAVGWSDRLTVTLLPTGIVLLGVFLVVELRTAQPLLPLRLFADRNRAAGYLNFFAGPAAGMSMFFFLTQFMQVIRGQSALTTGLAFLPLAGVMFGMSRLVPRLLPRFGPRPLALTGSLILSAGLLWLTRLSPHTGYLPVIGLTMMLLGLGMGLGFVPLTPIIMGSVPPQDAGAAGGALQTMQQLGATLGLAVLVTVFGATVRHAGTGAAGLVTGMTHAFAVSTCFAAFTFLVALSFRRRT
jgi:EmrB/QacA subfamily drug resistance transporter